LDPNNKKDKHISILSDSDCKSYDILEKRTILLFNNSFCELIKIKDMEHIQNPKDNCKIGNKTSNYREMESSPMMNTNSSSNNNNKASNPKDNLLAFLQKNHKEQKMNKKIHLTKTSILCCQ